MNTKIDRLQCVEEYLAFMTFLIDEAYAKYKQLIAERKERLAVITFMRAMQFIGSKTEKLANTSEAVNYNENTDQDVLERIKLIYGQN